MSLAESDGFRGLTSPGGAFEASVGDFANAGCVGKLQGGRVMDVCEFLGSLMVPQKQNKN